MGNSPGEFPRKTPPAEVLLKVNPNPNSTPNSTNPNLNAALTAKPYQGVSRVNLPEGIGQGVFRTLLRRYQTMIFFHSVVKLFLSKYCTLHLFHV